MATSYEIKDGLNFSCPKSPRLSKPRHFLNGIAYGKDRQMNSILISANEERTFLCRKLTSIPKGSQRMWSARPRTRGFAVRCGGGARIRGGSGTCPSSLCASLELQRTAFAPCGDSAFADRSRLWPTKVGWQASLL